jgi:hypothetical protein
MAKHDFNYEQVTSMVGLDAPDRVLALDALIDHLDLEVVRKESFSHGDDNKDVSFEIRKKGTTPYGLREV